MSMVPENLQVDSSKSILEQVTGQENLFGQGIRNLTGQQTDPTVPEFNEARQNVVKTFSNIGAGFQQFFGKLGDWRIWLVIVVVVILVLVAIIKGR